MSADLYIHIMGDSLTLQELEAFRQDPIDEWDGTEEGFNDDIKYKILAHDKVKDKVLDNTGGPSCHVGEVSWLKASAFGPEEFVPQPVDFIYELFNPYAKITDDLIEMVNQLYDTSKNTTEYSIEEKQTILDFLKNHKEKYGYTISW